METHNPDARLSGPYVIPRLREHYTPHILSIYICGIQNILLYIYAYVPCALNYYNTSPPNTIIHGI